MRLLGSASRSRGCKGLLVCTCCCSWARGVCAMRCSCKSLLGCAICCSWIRGVCGGARREAEEPLTLETKRKRKSTTAASPELEKNRWGTKTIWRKKKGKSEPSGLANLVKEISLSNSPKQRAAAGEILRIGNHNIPSRVFTFRQLADATNSFSPENLLGEGGFGRVYRGYIPDTMEVIAVKQLDKEGLQGNREFLVEVLMLSLLHHPNLVTLLGYSTDCDQRILVYEYMPLAPLFRDKTKFVKMADPLMDMKFPLKGLYQALAISSMCLQEEASSRPLISDVVTALTFLADPNYDPPEEDINPLPITTPNLDGENTDPKDDDDDDEEQDKSGEEGS
ncbi:hypothetical protein ABZP36_030287 [Zizania latifolia]